MAKSMNVTQSPVEIGKAAAEMVQHGLADIEAWEWLMSVARETGTKIIAAEAFVHSLPQVSPELVRTVADFTSVYPRAGWWLFETGEVNADGTYTVDLGKVTDPELLRYLLVANKAEDALIETGAGKRIPLETWEEWANTNPSRPRRYAAAGCSWLPISLRVRLLTFRDADGKPQGKLYTHLANEAEALTIHRVFIEAADEELDALYGSASLGVLRALHDVGFVDESMAKAFVESLVEALDHLGPAVFHVFGTICMRDICSAGDPEADLTFPFYPSDPGAQEAVEKAIDLLRRGAVVKGLVDRGVDPLLMLLRANYHSKPTDELVESVRRARPTKDRLEKALRVCVTDQERQLVLDAGAKHHSAATLRKLADHLPAFYAAGRMPLVDALVTFGGGAVMRWAEHHNIPPGKLLALAGAQPDLTLDDLAGILAPV